jgi:hypothetical protein
MSYGNLYEVRRVPGSVLFYFICRSCGKGYLTQGRHFIERREAIRAARHHCTIKHGKWRGSIG